MSEPLGVLPAPIGSVPLAQSWKLSDGTTVTLRDVDPADEDRLRAFFNRLSEQARYERFFHGAPAITEELLAYFLAADGRRHVGLIITAPDGSSIIGDGRLVTTEPGEAEVALAVADAWQGRGIGRRLLRTLLALAREHRIVRVRADFLSENRRMMGLLRDAEFVFRRIPGNAIVGSASRSISLEGLEITAPGPTSLEGARA